MATITGGLLISRYIYGICCLTFRGLEQNNSEKKTLICCVPLTVFTFIFLVTCPVPDLHMHSSVAWWGHGKGHRGRSIMDFARGRPDDYLQGHGALRSRAIQDARVPVCLGEKRSSGVSSTTIEQGLSSRASLGRTPGSSHVTSSM